MIKAPGFKTLPPSSRSSRYLRLGCQKGYLFVRHPKTSRVAAHEPQTPGHWIVEDALTRDTVIELPHGIIKYGTPISWKRNFSTEEGSRRRGSFYSHLHLPSLNLIWPQSRVLVARWISDAWPAASLELASAPQTCVSVLMRRIVRGMLPQLHPRELGQS